MFDIIEYSTPHKHGYTDYYSSSPLYNFIFELTHLEFFHEINELPHEVDYVYDKWVRLDESYVTEHNLLDNIMLKGNLPYDYIKKYGNPEIVGNYYVIEVSRLLANRSKYKRIIDSLSSNSCGIKKEYDLLKEYMHDLEKKYGNKPKLPPMMCLINSSIDSQQKKANRQRCRLAKRYDNIAKESHSNSCFIADNALQTIRFKYPNYYVTCGISARHNPNVRPYTMIHRTGRR